MMGKKLKKYKTDVHVKKKKKEKRGRHGTVEARALWSPEIPREMGWNPIHSPRGD